MSTQIHTRSGELVATRYAGGGGKVHVQMEVTPREYEDYKHTEVGENDSPPYEPLHKWLGRHNNNQHKIIWDTAQHRNEVARSIENRANDPRFKQYTHVIKAHAAKVRSQAKAAAKDSIHVVKSESLISFKEFIIENDKFLQLIAGGASPEVIDQLFGKSARKRFLQMFQPWFYNGQDVGIDK